MTLSSFAARVKNKVLYRLRLDQRLSHWDDERYLKFMFRIRMGHRLNLDHPRTFNEKIQWLKIHDRRPLYTHLVDKFEAKKWVTARLGESRVVPLLGVWDSFNEIDFDALPAQFVLKCTHDSGGLAICTDRASFDIDQARDNISKSLKRNYYMLGREWPYKNVQPRILAEVYLPAWRPSASAQSPTYSPELVDGTGSSSAEDAEVVDYKFFCFDGEPKFLLVSKGLHKKGSQPERNFVTVEWEPEDFTCLGYTPASTFPYKPSSFGEMLSITRNLASGFPFVRVDLFEHEGRAIFSEMTLHPASGFAPWDPSSKDRELGALLDISKLSASGGSEAPIGPEH